MDYAKLQDERDAMMEQRDKLADALAAFVEMYTAMVNSGDCGNWDPDGDPEVIAARAVLAEVS